jgi:hypothetical protein
MNAVIYSGTYVAHIRIEKGSQKRVPIWKSGLNLISIVKFI